MKITRDDDPDRMLTPPERTVFAAKIIEALVKTGKVRARINGGQLQIHAGDLMAWLDKELPEPKDGESAGSEPKGE